VEAATGVEFPVRAWSVEKGMVEHLTGFSLSWEKNDCKDAGKLKVLFDDVMAKQGIR
jgi:hypothetical protein